MNDREIKLLIDLAKKLKEETISKEEAMASFVSAGILDEKGEFTKHYSELRSYIVEEAEA
ncbi:hypothetical protein [uncultured Flavobacterium sp.]|uniref:hypothetical protein n=1 Tax=uncultured Flavobacterium sp. TaxID=165435 RepID=UPI0025E7E5F6|nr:hypothetical protein [uncultured Flavobacterium sp.]